MKKYASFKTCLAFILFCVAIRTVVAWKMPLSLDETYYYYWSCNPQLSYYDHPPMIAYFIYPFRWLGYTSIAARASCVLSFLLISIILWKWVSKAFNPSIALKSVILLNVSVPFALGSLIATPDTPLALFWVIALYMSYMAIFYSKPSYWYLTGLAIGLGLLSKYTMVLFILSIFIFLLTQKQYRYWLFRKEVYLALGIAFACFLPVIYWNYLQGWQSFFYQFKHGLSSKRGLITFRYIIPYIFQQVGLLTPLLFIGMIICVVKAFRSSDSKLRYMAMFPVVTFLFFGIGSFRARSEANWPVVGYTSGIVLFSVMYSANDNLKRGQKMFWRFTLWFCVIVVIIMHVQPFYKFLPISPKIDKTNRLVFGVEISKQVEKERKKFGENLPLMCDTHQLSTALHFYLPDHPVIYEVRKSGRYPWIDQSVVENKDVLLVTMPYTTKNNQYLYGEYFKELSFVKRLSVQRENTELKVYYLMFGIKYRAKPIK